MEKQPLSGDVHLGPIPPGVVPKEGYQAVTSQPYPASQPLPAPVYHHVEPEEQFPSLLCPILLSCLVFWCINPLFGAAAFLVGCLGHAAYTSREAWRMKRVSVWLSITGIIVSLIVATIVLIVRFTVGM